MAQEEEPETHPEDLDEGEFSGNYPMPTPVDGGGRLGTDLDGAAGVQDEFVGKSTDRREKYFEDIQRTLEDSKKTVYPTGYITDPSVLDIPDEEPEPEPQATSRKSSKSGS